MKFKFLTFLLFLCCGICGAKAQEVALKTNLLSDAFLNPNLAAEVALAPRWTIDVSGQFNTWNLSHDRKWKHWVVQPEIRYWFCDRFAGHFVGAHCSADSITSAVSTSLSLSWEQTSRNLRIPATRDGSEVSVSPTDMHGQ